MVYSYILIALAAIFKAVADTCADHYSTSIFRHKDPNFWNKSVSWKYSKRVFAYPIDGWHIANSLMIFSFLGLNNFKGYFSQWYWNFLIGGVLFVIVFNLFYNKILYRK